MSTNRIQILDCTLRDGGYCNDFRFGFEAKKQIVEKLLEANIDIIEVGFLTQKVSYDADRTLFTSLEEVKTILPVKKKERMFLLMMDYGKYDIDTIPVCDNTSVDGIRVSFHKKDYMAALAQCKIIKEKGYKVFVQAMVSISYSDLEFLELIKKVNEIEPYAFYIVDSFGMMKSKDLMRFFYLVEHNLKPSIQIGFHSHNNLQLSYSNAQKFVAIQTDRNLIVDSCVYGMGRGAGNLNTELFLEYLNENGLGDYSIRPLLSIIDEFLDKFYKLHPWGYSLSNYLSASHNAHPNYAKYLEDKGTLTVEAMNDIFNLMDETKKYTYDQKYAENLYIEYLSYGIKQENNKELILKKFNEQEVLLIAPGKSSMDECFKIKEFLKKKQCVVISINFLFDKCPVDYLFVSNLRRFSKIEPKMKDKCIVTSRISDNNVFFRADYKELLNNVNIVEDNAGLMAIKFLMNYGVKTIYLAGFDGYSHSQEENYISEDLSVIMKNSIMDAMNSGMTKVMNEYAKKVSLSFVTSQRYIKLA